MISFSSIFLYAWEFYKLHPGIVLVLCGVVGEVACDWKEMGGRLAMAKKLSAGLLIFGLMLEFWDAAESDNKVTALNQKIEQIDPLNQPISSMRAEVSFSVRQSDLIEPYQSEPAKLESAKTVSFLILEKTDRTGFPQSEALLMLGCSDVRVAEGGSGMISPNVLATFTFSWPDANIPDALAAEHGRKFWVEKKRNRFGA